jgi:hypothetical protein
MSGFAGLCCIGSVGLLGGTVFWVRKMTFLNDASGLQAEALNLKMVFGHIALLLTQIAVVFLNAKVYYGSNFSRGYKIECTQYVINAALDTIVCCLICGLISDFDFQSRFKQGVQAVIKMTSSSETSESSDSEEDNPKKRTEKRVQNFRSEWLESFHSDNEYNLNYAQFEECVKHAAQFLTAFGAFEDSQASSTPSQSSEEQEQLRWPTLVLSERSSDEIDPTLQESANSIQ